MLIADICAKVANAGFETDMDKLPPGAAWLALLGYTLQIYFDFSGYSDMAIGLARMFGFHFPENFRHPYTALSVTDFWRRWHLSLSQWFRDYLYIPLGGSRVAPWKVYRNLLIVFLVTGFWHGAAWTFVLWGLYHGAFLMIERGLNVAAWSDQRLKVLRRLGTLVIIMISWAIFRSPDGASCLAFLGSLLGTGSKWHMPGNMVSLLDVQTMLAFGIGLLAFIAPRESTAGLYMSSAGQKPERIRAVVILALLPFVILQVMASDYSPFLYFQF